MNNIDSDSITIIQGFLTPVELIGLRYVARSFTHIDVARVFHAQMIRAISRVCGVNTEMAQVLLTRVNQYGGVISGSIVLQVLYGCKFESDIDIFFNINKPEYKDDGIVLQHVLQLTCIPAFINEIDSNYDSDDYDNHEIEPICSKDCGIPRRAVRSDYTLLYNYKERAIGESPYANVQIIKVKRGSWFSNHQCITDHFDMSIVMNTYSDKTLEVYDVGLLLKKQNHACVDFVSASRIDKYENRGFPLYKPYVYTGAYQHPSGPYKRVIDAMKQLFIDDSKDNEYD